MATEEELKQQLEELRRKLKDTETQLQQGNAASNKTNVIVHTTTERKLRSFSEKDDVEEWVELVKLHATFRKMKIDEQPSYIIDHLGENPKRELQLQIDFKKATTSEIFDTLKDVFGSRKTLFMLQQEFFTLEQRENSIDEYSQLIMDSMLRLKKKDSVSYKKPETILKERFAEGLNHISLKREIRRLNREQPDLKFYELRDLAKQWTTDTHDEITSAESISAMRQTIQEQQQNIATLTQNYQSFNRSSRGFYKHRSRGRGQYRGSYRGRYGSWNQDGRPQTDVNEDTVPSSESPREPSQRVIICYNCNQPNHLARDCLLKKRNQAPTDNNQQEKPEGASNFHHS